jgi:putative RNA 2'-phosphotransferase
MISEKETTRISKFLSLVLRHKPEAIGLTLDENGWADVGELIDKMNGHNYKITRDILNSVVVTNNKQRFSFNGDKTKIRANQGHSIQVELDLKEMTPPEYLYHGTGEKAVTSILKTGLQKRARHHVHLSGDIATAITVGSRHGKPKVFTVAALQMLRDGYKFYLSENNVWLTDQVPVQYLNLIPDSIR